MKKFITFMGAQLALVIVAVLVAGLSWQFAILASAHVLTFFVIRLKLVHMAVWFVLNLAIVLVGYTHYGFGWWWSISPLLATYAVSMYQFIFEAAVYAKGQGFFKRRR